MLHENYMRGFLVHFLLLPYTAAAYDEIMLFITLFKDMKQFCWLTRTNRPGGVHKYSSGSLLEGWEEALQKEALSSSQLKKELGLSAAENS